LKGVNGAVLQANVRKYSKTFKNSIEIFKNHIETFENYIEMFKN